MKLLREYQENNLLIREYTTDGINVSHKTELLLSNGIQKQVPTLEDINSKLDDITLLMLQQGGIIA